MENQKRDYLEMIGLGIVFTYIGSDLSFLLIKKSVGSFAGKWILPGGHLLNGVESITDGLVREIKEETNVFVLPLFPLSTQKIGNKIFHYWLCVPVNGLPIPVPDKKECICAQWIPLDQFKDLGIFERVEIDIRKLCNRINN